MCGIGGWFCWDESRPTKKIIEGLLLANETRGTDATGIAYLKGGETPGIFYKKAPLTASKFLGKLAEKDWETLCASPIGLTHTRAKTKGSPKNNENNHPVVGEGWLVVHNGVLTNDDDLFEYYYKEKPRFAEVDSAAIPLALSRAENAGDITSIVGQLTLLGGSATLAAWATASPDRVLLARMGFNDLYLFLHPEKRTLYWSSAPIFARHLPAYGVGGLRFLTYTKLEDDRVIMLDRKFEQTRTFKIGRRPFFALHPVVIRDGLSIKKQTQTQTMKATASVEVRAGAISTTGEENGVLARTTWLQEDDEMVKLQKPQPLMERLSRLPMFLMVEESKARAHKAHGHGLRRVLPTGYGRWKLLVLSDGKVEREFRFRRGVRKWLSNTLKIKNISLPASLSTRSLLDYKLPTEVFIRTSLNARSTAETTIPGFMCPWCGVHGPGHQWSENKFRCEFCCVASNPAKQ